MEVVLHLHLHPRLVPGRARRGVWSSGASPAMAVDGNLTGVDSYRKAVYITSDVRRLGAARHAGGLAVGGQQRVAHGTPDHGKTRGLTRRIRYPVVGIECPSDIHDEEDDKQNRSRRETKLHQGTTLIALSFWQHLNHVQTSHLAHRMRA